MIITNMDYLEPVYRGMVRGTNFEYVHVKAIGVTPQERDGLERVAKKWTYLLGIAGHHSHNQDNTHGRYRGIRNKVRFIQDHDDISIYIRGPRATEIGQEIEGLPFVQFSPSKEEIVRYDLESRVTDKHVLL